MDNFEEQIPEQPPIHSFKPQNFAPTAPPKRKFKWAVILFLAIAIAGLLTLRHYTMAKWPSSPAAYDPITLKPRQIGFLESVKNFVFRSDNVIAGQQEDRINILLLGIGGTGHDGPYLSDTNMILSIKPSTNQVALISIPRDLAIKVGNHGIRKINSADAFGEAEQADGGGEYARKIFEQNFGLSIPHYVRVDFTAFKELIDAVDGITINVPRSFVDTQYPGANNSYQTISFEAGLQQMDGDHALIFTRSRHGSNGEDSDFARSKRQQLVLAAFKQKMLSANTYLNPLTVQKIISSLSKHIITNLDFGQEMYLVGLGKSLNTDNLKTLVLDDSPNGFLKSIRSEDGAFLLVPKASDFSEINAAINNIFEATTTASSHFSGENKTTTTSAAIPSISIEIQNGTWHAGLAAIKKQDLEKDGLIITSISNSAKRPIATTAIYVKNPNVSSSIVASLASKLHASATATLPEWLERAYTSSTAASDIIIILGEDAQ